MPLALTVGSGRGASVRRAVMGAVVGVGLILTILAGTAPLTGYAIYLSFWPTRSTGADSSNRHVAFVVKTASTRPQRNGPITQRSGLFSD